MATSEWGSFEWGAAEWGSVEDAGPDMSAAGSFVMTGEAQLQTIQVFDAAGSLVLSGVAELSTEIFLTASGLMELTGEAALQAAKAAARLSGCGHVLAADCDQWLVQPFL